MILLPKNKANSENISNQLKIRDYKVSRYEVKESNYIRLNKVKETQQLNTKHDSSLDLFATKDSVGILSKNNGSGNLSMSISKFSWLL